MKPAAPPVTVWSSQIPAKYFLHSLHKVRLPLSPDLRSRSELDEPLNTNDCLSHLTTLLKGDPDARAAAVVASRPRRFAQGGLLKWHQLAAEHFYFVTPRSWRGEQITLPLTRDQLQKRLTRAGSRTTLCIREEHSGTRSHILKLLGCRSVAELRVRYKFHQIRGFTTNEAMLEEVAQSDRTDSSVVAILPGVVLSQQLFLRANDFAAVRIAAILATPRVFWLAVPNGLQDPLLLEFCRLLKRYCEDTVRPPVVYQSVFLCHTTKDRELVDKIREVFRRKCVPCFCYGDLPLSDDWRIRISEEIRARDWTVVVLSKIAMTRPVVIGEIFAALNQDVLSPTERRLIPITTDDFARSKRALTTEERLVRKGIWKARWLSLLHERQWLDLQGWEMDESLVERCLERLLDRITWNASRVPPYRILS